MQLFWHPALGDPVVSMAAAVAIKGLTYKPGDKLLDVYVVERVLGEGGYNDVYLARHQILPRRYAIKVLRSSAVDNPTDLERLTKRVEREANILARFDHPNLPTLHDMRIDGGAPILVLEYVEGFNLETVLDKVEKLSVNDALYLGIEVTKPLSIAHRRDIVHRDIKPANIFCMTEEPPEGKAVVRLLDFGASRLLGEAKRLTQEHGFIGTIWYVAPEQLTSTAKPDHRADIYCLGLVLWECLTGRHPFWEEGLAMTGQQMGLRHVSMEAAYIRDLRPDVPTRFADLLQQMLAKNPANRPQTLQIVFDEMWAVLSTMDHTAQRSGQKLPTIFTRRGAVLPAGTPFAGRRHAHSAPAPPTDPLPENASENASENAPDTDLGPPISTSQRAPHSNTATDGMLEAVREVAPVVAAPLLSAKTKESGHAAVAGYTEEMAFKPTLAASVIESRSPRGTELLPNAPMNRPPASELAQKMLSLGQVAATPGNREMLEAALTHDSAEVRKAATQSLSRVGNALSRGAIQRVVASEQDPATRYVMELTIDLLTPKADPPGGMLGTVRMNDGFGPANPAPNAAIGSPPTGVSPKANSPASPLLSNPSPAGLPLRPTAKDLPIVTTLVDESDDARTTFITRLATSALTAPRVEERVRSLQALHETSAVHGARVELAKRAIDTHDIQLDDEARARSLADLRAGGVDHLLIQTIMRGAMRPVSERMQVECIQLLAHEGDSRHALFLEQLRRDYVLSPSIAGLVEQSIARVSTRLPIDFPSILPLLPPSPVAGAGVVRAERAQSVFEIRGQDIVAVVAAIAVVSVVVVILVATKVIVP